MATLPLRDGLATCARSARAPSKATQRSDVTSSKSSAARRLRELAIVLAGALALHVALLWPSLAGERVMLPADLLSPPSIYLPPPEDGPAEPPKNTLVTDLVFTLALHGDLAREQIREGRWPLWNPYSYCGAPLLGAAQAQALSPFSLVQIAMPLEFPRTLAWAQLLRACAAALGAFLCFRGTFRARAWPATFGAWMWTLSGFATMWTGFPHAEVVLELPLLVFAIDRTLARPRGLGLAGLAVVVALMLVAGHPSTAATAFLGAGAIGAWL